MKTIMPLILILLLTSIADAHGEDSFTQGLSNVWSIVSNKLNERADIRREKATTTARVVSRGAQPEIIISRTSVNENGNPLFENGFSFNGQFLNKGDTLGKAIQIFGPEYRKTKSGHLQWNKLGIYVMSYRPEYKVFNPMYKDEANVISYILIILNTEKAFIPTVSEPHQSLFKGYLELDKAGIDALTTIEDIRAMADRDGLEGAHGYIYCIIGRATCEVGRPPGDTGIEVAFTIDDENEEKKIDVVVLRLTS